jgi:hypothetical protein
LRCFGEPFVNLCQGNRNQVLPKIIVSFSAIDC